jgi:YjbE family integral membrane protein
MPQILEPQFLVAVVQIVWVDLVLSGDNAVVIAMACRDLPTRQRRLGMIIGAGAAAILLVAFTITVSVLMQLPWLRLGAACALIAIAVKLLGPQSHAAHGTPPAAAGLWRAVWLIVAADVVMSLDNAVAVAAIANGRYLLLGLGLAISIPTVVAGSAVVLALIGRFPIIVWIGGAMLGWVAGALFVSDPAVSPHVQALVPAIFGADGAAALHAFAQRSGLEPVELAFSLLGALIVILAGAVWRRMSADQRVS